MNVNQGFGQDMMDEEDDGPMPLDYFKMFLRNVLGRSMGKSMPFGEYSGGQTGSVLKNALVGTVKAAPMQARNELVNMLLSEIKVPLPGQGGIVTPDIMGAQKGILLANKLGEFRAGLGNGEGGREFRTSYTRHF